VDKKMLTTLSFVLLASVAEAQMNFEENFGGHAGDYDFGYILARFFGLFLLVIGLMVFIRKDQKAYFDQLVESKEFSVHYRFGYFNIGCIGCFYK
jgi:hypothetical protein